MNYSLDKQEWNQILEYQLSQGKMKSHDPFELVLKQCALVGIQWPYPHEIFKEELIYQGTKNFVDVLGDMFGRI